MALLLPYKDITSQSIPLELTSKRPYALSNTMVENERAKYSYPIRFTNMFERENWTVCTDHCYARPWNWRPESSFLKPTKMLFGAKSLGAKPLFSITGLPKSGDDFVDVDGLTDVEPPAPAYDMEKARGLMMECEKHATLVRHNSDDENWEEKIVKANWSHAQHRLFNGFVNILNNFYLGKMTYSNLKNEPVLRRAIIDKAVQRVRRLFNSFSYDIKLLQWIHQLLLDNLDQQNLSSYLDILQTLMSKTPKLLEKLLNAPSATNRMGPLNTENLLPLLKKPWDPVETSLAQDKPKKLPSNPVLVLMPCAPSVSKRHQKWLALLSNLGLVVSVPINFGSSSHRMTMTNYLDQMFSLARGRIQEAKENFPERHIILVGVGAGATLALQLAQVENIFCVVSLGFSMLTAEGRRGEPDDNLLELQCPVLFVIGQCSSTSFQEDVEDLRERMRIETGLIVVGSADNNLVVSKKKRREEGITQSIVDQCIIDEVGEFISSLILSPYPPQVRQSPTSVSAGDFQKKNKIERKRYNSNTSSIESEPSSPTSRIARPGRPAGSIKSKCKLEAKWAVQVAQGTFPSASLTASNSSSALSSLSYPSKSPHSSDTASASESPLDTSINHKFLLKPEGTIKKKRVIKMGSFLETGGRKGSGKGEEAPNKGQLSTLLQGGIKTIPAVSQKPIPSSPATIKILENVQLTSQTAAKLISNSTRRTIDLSKIGLGQRATSSNMVILPDGKIKSVKAAKPNINMKTSGGMPLVLTVPGKSTNQPIRPFTNTKILRSPKPLPVKKPPFPTFPLPIKTNFPPPTNLTSQEIMDLPIIFADDNQLIDPNMPTDLSTSSAVDQVDKPKFISPTPTNKYVIINKPTACSGLNNFIISPEAVKRPNTTSMMEQPAKYTKIILSKKSMEPFLFHGPSTAVSLNRDVDLETEIEATAVPKPGLGLDKGVFSVLAKRQFLEEEQIAMEDDDPDYVPPKNLKL
ncbi:KAT8 regulatory NSL complex subunit 3-like isoform X2 [Euwallacea similis]|uniref:KAT8 regulatory NSL complex subunit 3-like isoform X2 n=1 Tax=Euwallacea similis TaxID=1736056 RepID=UPI00344E1AA6